MVVGNALVSRRLATCMIFIVVRNLGGWQYDGWQRIRTPYQIISLNSPGGRTNSKKARPRPSKGSRNYQSIAGKMDGFCGSNKQR